jgi:hypothetical protein
MSIYSTIHLSRAKALELLVEHTFGPLSDRELADKIDPIVADRLYNVLLTDDPNNDDHLV